MTRFVTTFDLLKLVHMRGSAQMQQFECMSATKACCTSSCSCSSLSFSSAASKCLDLTALADLPTLLAPS